MSQYFNTCRLCHDMGSKNMVRYSTRHWVHIECGLEKWGTEAFMAKLQDHQIARIPDSLVQSNAVLKAWLQAWVERTQPAVIYFCR
jgi:hypothetical protein